MTYWTYYLQLKVTEHLKISYRRIFYQFSEELALVFWRYPGIFLPCSKLSEVELILVCKAFNCIIISVSYGKLSFCLWEKTEMTVSKESIRIQITHIQTIISLNFFHVSVYFLSKDYLLLALSFSFCSLFPTPFSIVI